MAEIKIEQKKQIWPWVLAGLVVAAVLVYFIVFRDNNNNSNSTTVEQVTETSYVSGTNNTNLLGVKENNSTVAAFVSFVENNNTQMSLDHEYTNEALLKLTAAINAMANEIGYDIQADLKKVKESASLIENEPFETSHANYIRNATDNATTALQNMQQAGYLGLKSEVDELKSASASINTEELTLDQKDVVKNYFAKASELLEKMN